ncbi:MAG: hypothetical protein NZM33_08225 [Bryobacteraceae bacterium]|nr:hypothetical protein [Bryobacteraceae bacterium]
MLEQQLERLRGAGIRIVPLGETSTHVLCEREGFAALVARREDALGPAGSTGLLTPRGFAALVWKQEGAVFVAKGWEQPATPEQVEALRRFAADLEAALRGS